MGDNEKNLTFSRGCSLALNTTLCNSKRFALTNGGIGLQQANIPCISRGKLSDI